MWFWTLGAYEVVRTISQAHECFSESFNLQVAGLKKELEKVRMPSAKMEKRRRKVPVVSNRSPDGWDHRNSDLLIGDPDDFLSAKSLLAMYDQTMTSLTPKDVILRHEDGYSKKKTSKQQIPDTSN